MTDEKEPDPLGQWDEPFADLPVPVEQDPFSVDEVADAVTVRAVRFESPIRDASGRVIPIGGLIFTFGNSATKSDRPPMAFAGTPEGLRNIGKLIRDAAYRSANLAEGKR